MSKSRVIKIIDINDYDVVFTARPLISIDMEDWQIKAELKLAHQKLDEVMNAWKQKTLHNILREPGAEYGFDKKKHMAALHEKQKAEMELNRK